MVAVNNTDLFRLGEQPMSSNGNVGSFAPTFINSAFTAFDPNASEEQKVEAITSGITGGIQFLLGLFGKKEDAAAKTEADRNEAAADNINNELNNIAQNTNQQIENIISQIESNIAQIQENLEQVEDSNKEKEKIQNTIETQTKAIAESTETLNDPNASKEEKEAARAAISGVATVITDLFSQVQDLTKTSEEIFELTNTLGTSTEDLNNESSDIIATATQNTQNQVQNITQQQVVNTTTGVKAGVNQTTEVAANTAAAGFEAGSKGCSFIPIVGGFLNGAGQATAMKLIEVANDQGGAAMTRFGSVANITGILGTATNLIGSNLGSFTNFSTSIGGLFNDGQGFFQNFQTFFEPLGTWLASATELQTQGEKIAEAVETTETGNGTEETEETGAEEKKVVIDTEILEELSA